MSGDTGTVLEAARGYVARGLEVFPLRGKEPAISTKDGGHGVHDATSDDALLVEWFTDRYTNIGVAIPPDVYVLDIDVQHNGHLQYKEWVAEHGKEWIATAPRQRTGNGGVHAWFHYDGPMPRYARKDIPGIELGRVGRYVIVAPSIHPNGNQYRWEVPLPSHIDRLADYPTLPDWFLELYAPEPAAPIGELRTYTGDDELSAAVHKATSWYVLLTRYGWRSTRGNGDEDGSVWLHPSATAKSSATIKHDCLFVYSPNTPFSETTYSDPHGVTLFRAYATLEHRGDYKQAAKTLRQAGHLPDHGLDLGPNVRLEDLIAKSVKPISEKEEDDEPEADKLGPRTHWPTFWRQEDDPDLRWLSEPVVTKGRAHALYAGAKTGKSLLMLQLSAALATGRPFLDKPAHPPIPVVYCDYEMTEDDLRQRLGQFGYGPDDDLDQLSYYFLGAGASLDTTDGGLALIETAHDRGAQLVVVDTTARAVSGPENDSDTLRAFYRCSGVGLKRIGIGWVRIDHSGKDITKGQRGTSAKNDDVDVVWRLYPSGGDGAFDLEATHQRMGWVERKVPLQLAESEMDGRLTWQRRVGRSYGPGVKELAEQLDELGMPVDIPHRAAKAELKKRDMSVASERLLDALRWRREANTGLDQLVGNGQKGRSAPNSETTESPAKRNTHEKGGTR